MNKLDDPGLNWMNHLDGIGFIQIYKLDYPIWMKLDEQSGLSWMNLLDDPRTVGSN